ncbi:DNA-binding FadR family transcriptional regulator [Streptosporangium becharense]|uniref:DNA-binding FadR family transcriptional regulator n=1 Tax=Streptosporangium becharense TaxID=1816182 RepID=A0A7W9IAV7_9ACTN|nr:FCD domain-containing protein [Streptosporangium becharense]MBB2910655.1 DNA-binding FadR family transcriptional regulator [Streptosporangium becharense]MBB5817350.1 DNA-binding FadR family transcriptional regulator [Streptosporangium becharense]
MFSKPPARAQQLATDIEQLVTDRRLKPGDRIATMEELRAQTGYGRATIGETARLLSERGSVEVRPGRGGGLFVAQSNPVVRLRRTLLTVPHGGTTVSDAIAVREALEELIALEAARHRDERDIEELRRRVDGMRRAGDDVEAFLRANWALHERIADITPNELARAVYVGTIRCVADLAVRADSEDPPASGDYLERRVAVHEELVEAIAAGDEARTRAAVLAHGGDAAPRCAGPEAMTTG